MLLLITPNNYDNIITLLFYNKQVPKSIVSKVAVIFNITFANDD